MKKKNILGFASFCIAALLLFTACGLEQPTESMLEADHSEIERSESSVPMEESKMVV